MKKESKKEKQKELSLSRTEILLRRPEPFGDVRKYYRLVKGSSILMIVMLYYISLVSVVLRTETEKQLPIWLLIALNLVAVVALVGHYHRSLAGYAVCAIGSVIILILLSVGDGGNPVMLVSTSPEYGEAVRDGLKGTDFWILLAKAVCVVHALLSVLFIRSTLTVKEEPPLKGMNVKIQEFREWFSRKNKRTSLGWSPLEFWTTCVCVVLWMLVAQANPFVTSKYDLIALLCILIGALFVWIGRAYIGSLCLTGGFLTCCSMYQLRFQLDVPTVSAYLGAWLSLLFLVVEVYLRRIAIKEYDKGTNTGFLFGTRSVLGMDKKPKLTTHCFLIDLVLLGAGMNIVIMFPVHEMLSAYSGTYMNQQKDDLPLLFFLPLIVFVCAWSRSGLGFFSSGMMALWLLRTLRNASPYADGLFRFDSLEQHGSICESLTDRMNGYAVFVESVLLLYIVVSVIISVVFVRRRYGRTEAEVVD